MFRSPSHRAKRTLEVVSVLLFSAAGLFAQVSQPPAGATVIDRIEELTDWKTCGACGNAGGTGTQASYSMTRGVTSPATDGSSTEFSIGGGHPFKNAYWYIGHQGSPSHPVSYLRYEFDLYVPAASADAPQAIEFECQQKANGFIYNFAWQAEYPDHEWRVFNYTARKWEASGVSFDGFTPNTWHHIVAEFHAQGSSVFHDALTVDGIRHVVNLKHSAKSSSSGHYLTNAFQLDLNRNATAYKVYVDGMTVSYK